MASRTEVAIVGGGPAGLATAIAVARAGLSSIVLEKSSGPPDKACGEGLMPAGVRILEALGARALLDPADCAPFVGIRYLQEDGASATGRLPAPGLGIRRTALTNALARRAAECGAELRWGCTVKELTVSASGVFVTTDGESVVAQVLVAADGVSSRLRRLAGLEGRPARRQRMGLRQHFQVAPWSECVEVHLTSGMEAFVTPAGTTRVGVAFLWEKAALSGPATIEACLARFPALASRLDGVPVDSRPRGGGPFPARVRATVADRVVLAGDAAGYVDAITGEGVSLALACAQALGELLPRALAAGATRAALQPYARRHAREFRHYALVCRSVLGVARRPKLRRRILGFLGRHPRLFDRILAVALR